jgi:hypothetical protein
LSPIKSNQINGEFHMKRSHLVISTFLACLAFGSVQAYGAQTAAEGTAATKTCKKSCKSITDPTEKKECRKAKKAKRKQKNQGI